MKKFLRSTLLVVFTLVLMGVFHNIEAKAANNFDDNGNGTVSLTFNNTSGKQTVVSVVNNDKKDSKIYYYKLGKGNNNVDVPLTLGNGKYTIKVLELIEGNRYSSLLAQEINLKLSNANEVFLQSSIIVNYRISDDVIKKATSITSKAKTDSDKVKAIYEYIIKNFKYDYTDLNKKTNTFLYVPDVKIVYKNKTGICYDISILAASMIRSQGIEVKVVTGYTPNVNVYHAWNQVYNSSTGKWYTIDATYDMCKYQSGSKNTTMIKKDSEYKDIVYIY